MTSPRNQYWRRIVPVVGEPIPDGAECYRPVPRTVSNMEPGEWTDVHSRGEFTAASLSYKWRVPVPVVPLSVAVDLVAELLRHGFRGVFNVNPNELSCMEEFPEIVTAKLIELAEQEMSNGTH